MATVSVSPKGLRKLNCNPQKSHFCVGKLGRGSCIPNSKACRYVLKEGVETTIAAGTVAGTVAGEPKPVAPAPEPKPKTIVSIPENSVISDDPAITPNAIDKALQVLADNDPEYADRFDRFSEFLALRGTVSVFRDANADPGAAKMRTLEIAKNLQVGHPLIFQAMRYFDYTQDLSPLENLLGHQQDAWGYTFKESKHIVVSSQPGYPGLSSADVQDLTETSIASIKRAITNPTDPAWSVGGKRLLATYFHEIGHQVHFAANEPNPTPKVHLVSWYAGYDDYELFAEAFCAYMTSPREYKAFDPVGFKFVEDTLQQAIEKEKKGGAKKK